MAKKLMFSYNDIVYLAAEAEQGIFRPLKVVGRSDSEHFDYHLIAANGKSSHFDFSLEKDLLKEREALVLAINSLSRRFSQAIENCQREIRRLEMKLIKSAEKTDD